MFKRIFLTFIFVILIINPVMAGEKKKTPTIEEIQKTIAENADNYEIVKYNEPAGSKELNLFGITNKGQYNLNAVASPDYRYIAYSEVYSYPQTRVTAGSVDLIKLDPNKPHKQSLLEASTRDKDLDPIIKTNMKSSIPYKFNTFTVVDWNNDSDKILIKEKAGKNFDQIYYTKIYVYDLNLQSVIELDAIRKAIVYFWKNKGTNLDDLKWDILPLGWDALNPNRIIVLAYGYHGSDKKFLGAWSIDIKGQKTLLVSLTNEKHKIASNGYCLKFIAPPDVDPEIKKKEDAAKPPVYPAEPLKQIK